MKRVQNEKAPASLVVVWIDLHQTIRPTSHFFLGKSEGKGGQVETDDDDDSLLQRPSVTLILRYI